MANYRFTPRNHLQCLALFETHATRLTNLVRLGHETYLERANAVAVGAFCIRHFATRVLTFHPDGLLTVGTGGYASVSTTERLNTFAPDGLHFRRLSGQKHLFPTEISVWTGREPAPMHRFLEGDRETATLRQASAEDGTWEVVA